MKIILGSILVISSTIMLCRNLKPENHKFQILPNTILNLYDAFGKDSTLTKDFGFSCITNYQGKIILFDSGSNADIFKNNVTQLHVDLKKVDIVVVSHGHFDHLNGLDYLLQINPNVKIYFPYDIFWGAPVPYDATGQEPAVKDSLPMELQYFDGGPTKFVIQQTGRFWKANVEYVQNSKEILPGLTIVATKSNYMGYFSCYPNKSFVSDHFEQAKDECKQNGLPELSLSIKSKNGQVLLVGCSHTGVENIVRESISFSKLPVDLVYGGFHMLPFNRSQTLDLIQQLKTDMKVKRVAPAHCTGHLAFKLLQDAYTKDFLYAGLGSTVVFD